jgi:colicin import membrane protein
VPSGEFLRPYAVPRAGKKLPSVLLAVLMHGLLLVFLFFGLNWQTRTPQTVDAELWSSLPQIAAPRASAPPPEPTPPVQTPQVDVQPIKVVPPPEPPPVADILIKEPVKKPPPKTTPPPPPQPAPKAKTVAPPKPEKPVPPSDLAMLQNQANAPSTGTAAFTGGQRGDDKYAGRIAAIVKSHTNFPPPAGVVGNPTVMIRIQLLPSGEVRDLQIEKESGIPAFDDAVVRGIRASSPLPKDVNGRVEPTLDLNYSMFDQGPGGRN